MYKPSWVEKELVIDPRNYHAVLSYSDKGKSVERLQEWLTIAGYATAIDGVFGPATKVALSRYRKVMGANDAPDGTCTREIFSVLVSPLKNAIQATIHSRNFLQNVVHFAERHYQVTPLEVGGENKGPWVRIYMQGKDGGVHPWCAGFVSFILYQTAYSSGISLDMKYHFSVDAMVKEAKRNDRFITEGNRTVKPGYIFCVKRSETDWSHTGFVVDVKKDCFVTIEGNTNDSGSREDYTVCRRIRGWKGKDFIKVEV